jgi:DNA-directed RNA polymerase specialized sigma subunit
MLTVEQRQSLVLSHLPLAASMARQKSCRTHSKVTYDELQSAAFLGLVKYASRFENGEFRPQMRIMGEMKDYLRSIGWGPKGRFGAVSIDHLDKAA